MNLSAVYECKINLFYFGGVMLILLFGARPID